MKTKKHLPFAIIVLLLFSISFSAQEKDENQENNLFDIIHIDGKFKKNQLLLEFLTRDSRFGGNNGQLKKMIEKQRNLNTGSYETQNLRNNKKFGTPTPSLYIVYYDQEIILGEGINRFYLIDQVRLEDIKTIKRKISGVDNEIFVETMPKK